MFTAVAGRVPAVAYSHPWGGLGFDERRAALLRGRPGKRVAYFYERPDTSTFRYRVHNMIGALRQVDPDVGTAWFCTEDLPRMAGVLERADVLVLCRTRYSEPVARLIAQARALGVRVLFDVDDLVFDDRYVHLILETLDQRLDEAAWNHWFAYIGRTGAALRLCDGAIVTNSYLASRVHAFCGLPAAVVPNFLNPGQVALSRRILEAKAANGFARDGRIHLGYFSGTPTHNRDLEVAAPALRRLLAEDRRLVLRIVGFMDRPGERFPGVDGRIEVFPLQDFLNLQRLIGEVELNLVPLQDNVFTNCKSELKVFEASVVGTLSVVSPSYTLRGAVEEGVTGWIAQSHGWEEALARAIDRLDRYPEMALAAERAALERFGPERQGPAILTALFGEPAAAAAAATGHAGRLTFSNGIAPVA